MADYREILRQSAFDYFSALEHDKTPPTPGSNTMKEIDISDREDVTIEKSGGDS